MRMMMAAVLAVAPVALAAQEDKSYAAHEFVVLMADQPCAEPLAVIDSGAGGMLRIPVVWGFILGFDRAHDGLHDATSTTLERLRKACAENPTDSAVVILTRFAEEKRRQ